MSLAAWLTTLQFAIVYAIFALSFFAPISAGVLSVASISSGAVGGFLYAWLAPATSLSALLSLALGGVAGGVVAYALSFAMLRLSSHYLAFATIALILVTNVFVLNLPSVTGGVNGRIVPSALGWPYLLGTLLVCCWVFWRLRSSRIGLAAAVIREDPLVGGGIGINPREIQRLHFTLGGVVGGLSGVLLASLLQYIDPLTFYTPLAFTCLAAVVLGSAYHWQGALIGGFVFTLLPYLFRSYFSPSVDQVVNGVVIVLVVIFLPGGLYDARRWLRPALNRMVRPAPAPAPAPERPAEPGLVAVQARSVTATAGDPAPANRPVVAGPLLDTTDPLGGPPAQPAMAAVGLRKVFGGVRAVDDLTLRVPSGCVFGVLGPNGAGKTTLINLLSGVFKADSGTTTVLGQDTTGWPSYRIARLGVARTYQNIRLSPGLSTLDTIVSGAYIRRDSNILSVIGSLPSERNERRIYADEARDLMRVVGISTPPERMAQTLSYGEQRRVEIARALASRPSVLLLDEPTAGMNARESAALGELLRELAARGLTIVLIEHNIRLVTEYCDRAAVMQSGALLAEGHPAECLAREDVQTAYFGRRADAHRIQSLRIVRVDSGD